MALMGALMPQPAIAQDAKARTENGTATQEYRVEGSVTDQSGAAVGGAAVRFEGRRSVAEQDTSKDGRFSFTVGEPSGVLKVRAAGFAPLEVNWNAERNGTALQLMLAPAMHTEQITVTAVRAPARLSDTPASVLVLTSEDLATTSALTLDDALRQVPGFSLFRRSGSRTANPTTQGVTLRGFGASGASRAVVLEDGIPLNDPFGGWIYWDRLPRAAVESVEVVRGASSHLYGSDAIGGVVNIRTRKLEGSALALETSMATASTPDASLLAQATAGRWGVSVAAAAARTNGYILVAPDQRGPVDTPANSQHGDLDFTLERRLSGTSRIFARGSIFGESRHNGTPLQTNRTHIYQATLGADWESRALGAASVRVYGGPQEFHQNFSAVSANRSTENLTNAQQVPAQQLGLSAQMSRPAGNRHTIVAGIEAGDVRGASRELVFSGTPRAVDAGGRQRTIGAFGEEILRLAPRWILTAGARVDSWRNVDGLSTTTPLASPGAASTTRFTDRTETAFSPRLAALHRLTEQVSLTASVYRGFRAPTLNELYRSFRVGDVLTLANDQLRAERLTGGEFGAGFTAPNHRLALSAEFFWSEVGRPIANVTLSAMPGLITRQRQNLGRLRSRGVSFDGEFRLSSSLVVSGGYQFADAIVLSFPANPALQGLDVPQVPRHQGTLQLRYANPRRFTLGIQGRATSGQFEDDQNLLRLGSYAVFDAFLSRSFGRDLEVFAAAENLFNQRYTIWRTPVRTIAAPVLARLGIRLRLRAGAGHEQARGSAAR